MKRPEDIPQDVFEAAFAVVSEIQMQDAGSVESWDARASVARVARALLAERQAATAKERERCAKVIEDNAIVDSSDGQFLRPRGDGNMAGLAYAASIRKGSP